MNQVGLELGTTLRYTLQVQPRLINKLGANSQQSSKQRVAAHEDSNMAYSRICRVVKQGQCAHVLGDS
jgi:hypothetical protein